MNSKTILSNPILFQNEQSAVVCDIYDSNEELQTIPTLSDIMEELRSTVKGIDEIIVGLNEQNIDYPSMQQILLKRLVGDMKKPISKLVAYASTTTDVMLQHSVNVKLSDFVRKSEQESFERIDKMMALIVEHMVHIEPFYYTMASLKKLQDGVAELKELAKDKSSSKNLCETLKTKAKEQSVQQKSILKQVQVLVSSVDDVHHRDVTQMVSAIKAKPSRTPGEMSISSMVRGSDGKELNNAILEFYYDPDGSIYDKYSEHKELIGKDQLQPTFTRITTTMGISRCKNVPAGYYTVFCKMNGYEIKVGYYPVNDHNLTRISLVLDPLPDRLPR